MVDAGRLRAGLVRRRVRGVRGELSVLEVERPDHIDGLAHLLTPDQMRMAERLHALWVRRQRRVVACYGSVARSDGAALDEMADELRGRLRLMGPLCSAEVVAIVCCGETQRPGGLRRALGLVREGLSAADEWSPPLDA